MSLHRTCCMDPCSGDPCAPSCDCLSSYLVRFMSLTHSWVRSELNPTPCNLPCDDYDGPNLHTSEGLSITGNQFGSAVLTKYTLGSSCCYRAVGNFQLNCSYSNTQKFYCCGVNGAQPSICTNSATANATVYPAFCLTARCGPNPATGEKGWIWELTICSFALENVQIIASVDCNSLVTCASYPRNFVGIYVGPAYYMWWTPLKCPPSIVNPTDYRYASGCHPLEWASLCGPAYPGSDPTGYGTQCMHDLAMISQLRGPFSITQIVPWDEGETPADCLPTYGSLGTWTDCGGNMIPGRCANQIDWKNECCEVTLSSAIGYPTFT